ncbi:FecR family protein [Dyadobacter tibetensis]|uniref:FecR family protein n=1 Tax=Dyadobacter tibetensis TaxID=1211851 RepID=UPI00047200BC|nr:FecR family protein [Dyadobacter tibetensis]
MTQQELDRIIQKYQRGCTSPEEDDLLEEWANSQLEDGEDIVLAERNQMEEGWRNICRQTGMQRPWPGWKMLGIWSGLAATVAIGMLWIIQSDFIGKKVHHGIESINMAASPQKVILPDGSLVFLEQGAKVVTDQSYGDSLRTVYLTGEAFFDIVSNPKRPFRVYVGNLVTEVLGTSFRIRPQKANSTVEVSVSTGRVSVYDCEIDQHFKKNGVILTPNQKVVYDTQYKTLRSDIVDDPKPVVLDSQDIIAEYDEVSFSDILKQMQQIYGVEIVLSNPALGKCAFTGNLRGLSMFKQLDLICGVVNAHYEVRGITIFISGTGCPSE